MNVIQAIVDLLYEHDTVIVPALGAFVRHDEGAQVNVITNEFQKPSSTIGFDPNQREENPLIIEYLMQHENLTHEEARNQVAAFVADCYARMREGETMVLEGLGRLKLNSIREPVLEPENPADFNPDAFGLTDLEATPVYRTETLQEHADVKSDPKEMAVIEPEEKPRRATWWIWLLLALLLGAAALWYLKFRPIPPRQQPPAPLDTIMAMDTINPMTEDSLESKGATDIPVDTMLTKADSSVSPTDAIVPEAMSEFVSPTEVVKPFADSKAFIVGGCFSVEQNALNMAVEAYEQGCKEVFVMKRGTKFFVCYGQYRNTNEAKSVLPDILMNYNQKAWILVK